MNKDTLYHYDNFTIEKVEKVLKEVFNNRTDKQKAWDAVYDNMTPFMQDTVNKEVLKKFNVARKDMKKDEEEIEYSDEAKALLTKALEQEGVKEAVAPLEKGESLEVRRINNLQKAGKDPFKPHNLMIFTMIGTHKSIWRAMRRGHVSVSGEEFPDRPFNNRSNTSNRAGVESRRTNEFKKQIYGEYKKVSNRA